MLSSGGRHLAPVTAAGAQSLARNAHAPFCQRAAHSGSRLVLAWEQVRREMAPIAAAGAWNMGQWDAMETYVTAIEPRRAPSTSATAFLRAVLDVHKAAFRSARGVPLGLGPGGRGGALQWGCSAEASGNPGHRGHCVQACSHAPSDVQHATHPVCKPRG